MGVMKQLVVFVIHLEYAFGFKFHTPMLAVQSVPLYLSEMAPFRHRGAINNGFHFSLGIGVLSANLINYGTEKIKGGWGWRVSLGMGAVPAAILTVGAIFLSETPISLIQQTNDHQKAKLMLQELEAPKTCKQNLTIS